MRHSRDLLVAANQQVTHDWWANHRARYELFVSQVVVDECSAGDPTAASERLNFLAQLTVLQLDSMAKAVAAELFTEAGFPPKAVYDAFHIAAAAQAGIDYLLTWNCRHIANPSWQRKINKVLSAHGLEHPIICTPQELLGE